MIKALKTAKLALISIFIISLLALSPVVVLAAAQFRGGNNFLVGNTTNPAAGWGDPISANIGDIVEYKFAIYNDGDQPAKNVRVKADLPGEVSGNSLTVTFRVVADNVGEVTDTVTVNIPASATVKRLDYFGGHEVVIDNNGTKNLPRTITTEWINLSPLVGDVQPGASNRVDVIFKATVAERVVTTPTPTATLTPTPTATPTVTSTPTPTAVITSPPLQTFKCEGNTTAFFYNGQIICLSQQQYQDLVKQINITNNNTNNNNNVNNITLPSGVVLAAGAPAPVPVKKAAGKVAGVSELPKTGLPMAAWALAGLLPLGYGLKRIGQLRKDNKDTAGYIWQRREFDKS